MLSYRHAFHAGSFADVLKHAVYVFALRHAAQKPKPLLVLDTHAGAGRYDPASAEARKTGEHGRGIARLLDAPDPPELLVPYLDLVRRERPAYPGSPALALACLRPVDRLELVELHPTDHAILAQAMAAEPRVKVRREDGLAALVARMPPPERRGVVLIDPSYEIKSDYAAVVRALAMAHRRFATGIYLLWYPVIERGSVEALMRALAETGIPGQYRIELGQEPDAPGRGMTGSGLVILNPPWTLPAAAAAALPWLVRHLDASGPVFSDWLVPERVSSAR